VHPVGVDPGGTRALLAPAAIGGAALLHLARSVRLRSRPGTAVVTLAPVSLVPAAVAELGLLAGRRWRAAAVGATVLAGCAAVHAPAFRRTAASAARRPHGDPLTVMTANLLHGRADVAALARTARRHEVDVLCVQEVHQRALDALADRVADQLPHRHSRPGHRGAGSGIFSRHRLANAQAPEGFGFSPVMADVLAPTADGVRPITVQSFHSKAPVGNGSTRFWAADLARLGRLMADHPGPLVIAGDFNATAEHRQFRDLLTGGYRDAARDAGAGLAFTFPAKRFRVPIAALDHIVLGPGLVGLDVRTAGQPGSDHRAVIARVAAG
jgi:endonuclease/exonuclease/phosphatase (EEP) superfamily protein YafD